MNLSKLANINRTFYACLVTVSSIYAVLIRTFWHATCWKILSSHFWCYSLL